MDARALGTPHVTTASTESTGNGQVEDFRGDRTVPPPVAAGEEPLTQLTRLASIVLR
jgi:hypothetical protein